MLRVRRAIIGSKALLVSFVPNPDLRGLRSGLRAARGKCALGNEARIKKRSDRFGPLLSVSSYGTNRFLQQAQHVLRIAVGDLQHAVAGGDENLSARELGGLGGEVGVANLALSGAGVFQGHAQGVDR